MYLVSSKWIIVRKIFCNPSRIPVNCIFKMFWLIRSVEWIIERKLVVCFFFFSPLLFQVRWLWSDTMYGLYTWYIKASTCYTRIVFSIFFVQLSMLKQMIQRETSLSLYLFFLFFYIQRMNSEFLWISIVIKKKKTFSCYKHIFFLPYLTVLLLFQLILLEIVHTD